MVSCWWTLGLTVRDTIYDPGVILGHGLGLTTLRLPLIIITLFTILVRVSCILLDIRNTLVCPPEDPLSLSVRIWTSFSLAVCVISLVTWSVTPVTRVSGSPVSHSVTSNNSSGSISYVFVLFSTPIRLVHYLDVKFGRELGLVSSLGDFLKFVLSRYVTTLLSEPVVTPSIWSFPFRSPVVIRIGVSRKKLWVLMIK